MDAIVAKKFHHNMMNIEAFRNLYKTLVTSKDNDYLELDELPYEIIEIDTMTIGDDIYIKLTLPMPSSTIYDLKKLYSIPRRVADNMYRIPILETHWIADDQTNGQHMAGV